MSPEILAAQSSKVRHLLPPIGGKVYDQLVTCHLNFDS